MIDLEANPGAVCDPDKKDLFVYVKFSSSRKSTLEK
jgi:hypothetical protein